MMDIIHEYIRAVAVIKQQRWSKVVLVFWVVAGAYDLIVSQFIADDTAKRLPKIGEFVPFTWWVWLLVLALIIILALLQQAVELHRALDGEQRMPITALLREAERLGVNFGGGGHAVLTIAAELRQAATDGAVLIFGRRKPNREPALNRDEPLQLIPREHWSRYKIDALSLVMVEGAGVEYKPVADNSKTATYSLEQPEHYEGGYADLYVSSKRALRWLETKVPVLRKNSSKSKHV